MRKSAVFLLMVVFFLSTVSSSYAYTGQGYFEDRTQLFKNRSGVAQPALTDNDLTTGVWYNGDHALYTFPETVYVSRVKVNKTAGNFYFYYTDGSGKSVYYGILRNGGDTELDWSANPRSMKAISIQTLANQGFTLYELEFYIVDKTPPAVPVISTTTIGDGTATVNWSPVADGDLAGYNIYVDNVLHNASLVTGTSYTITGLTNLVNYTIRLTSVDTNNNESVKSIPITLTPSRPPDNLNLVSGLNTVSGYFMVMNYQKPLEIDKVRVLPYSYATLN